MADLFEVASVLSEIKEERDDKRHATFGAVPSDARWLLSFDDERKTFRDSPFAVAFCTAMLVLLISGLLGTFTLLLNSGDETLMVFERNFSFFNLSSRRIG